MSRAIRRIEDESLPTGLIQEGDVWRDGPDPILDRTFTIMSIVNEEVWLRYRDSTFGFRDAVGPFNSVVLFDTLLKRTKIKSINVLDVPEDTFTCPDCKRTSYHYKDILYKYCGNCNKFH